MTRMLSFAMSLAMMAAAFGTTMIFATADAGAGELPASGPLPEPLAPVPPFRIDSNGDFSTYASSGSGGNTDPWIIENLEIDGTGYGYAAYIGNTTEHFIMRNCTMHDAGGIGIVPYYPDAGIVLYNITKGNIDNCTSHNNSGSGILLTTNIRNVTVNGTKLADNNHGQEAWDTRNSRLSNITCTGNANFGFYMDHSQNMNITDSVMTGNNEGMRLFFSNGYLLRGNDASSNVNGLHLIASNNNDVFNNTVLSNTGTGILVDQASVNGSTVNSVSGNIVRYNGGGGISVIGAATQLNSLSGNNVTNNAAGISIGDSNNNTVSDNWIQSNNLGVAIQNAYNNTIFHNYIIDNVAQAYDDNVNQWNDAYPTGGNYWDDYSGVDIMSGDLQDQPGSDGFGDTPYVIDGDSADNYPLWFPADIDMIRIVDGPNGTGNPASSHEYASPWFNITLWAAAYNSTYGYVRDIWANWTNMNYGGAASSIDNASGYATTWRAGPNLGSALLTAEYNTAMTVDVNVTIATYQPDLMIDGRTDDVYENPPVTQKSWRNMTQGGSAAFDIVAENDGATTGSFTLAWDTSGLPGTFYAVMLDDDSNANVTATLNAGGLAFNLGSGARRNFTLLINSSTTAGFGQTGTVGLGLFPPSGEQDSAGAMAEICEPDYVVITDAPDGNPLTTVSMQIGEHVTAYASAYNGTGPEYIGLIPLDWADSPDLGTFDNASGTSSTFTATAQGTATITGTSTGLGLSDTFTVNIAAPADTAAPQSAVNFTEDYWLNESPKGIRADASDDISGVAEVTLWYRFSDDNLTWGSWTSFGTDSSSPWVWPFDFPDECGYYEFYTRAADNDGNIEAAPALADAACAFDDELPTLEIISMSVANTGDTIFINATLDDSIPETFPMTALVEDNMALGDVFLTYRFGDGNETNVTMAGNGSVRSVTLSVPVDSLDLIWVIFTATDMASNWNSTDNHGITVLDDDAPTADAGADLATDPGMEVSFDGTASADNIGVANYSWTFTHNGSAVTLWGAEPQFTFWTQGTYNVTLTVRDAAGNPDTDILVVTVDPPEGDGGDDSFLAPDICWIALVILAIFAALLLLLYFLRRKKKGEPETPAVETSEPAQDFVMVPSGGPEGTESDAGIP